jgi:hypothetical protein
MSKKWAPVQSPPSLTHHLRSLYVLLYSDSEFPNTRQTTSLSSSSPAMSSQLKSQLWPLPPPPLLAEMEGFGDEADGDESDDGDFARDAQRRRA